MIPKLNSSELNDIFINAYNEVNDKINEFSEICSDLSKKTKIINYEIEYAKYLMDKFDNKQSLGNYHNILCVDAIKGNYERYGATVHPQFIDVPSNVFNLKVASSNEYFFRNDVDVSISDTDKDNFQEEYKSILMHDSLQKKIVFDEYLNDTVTIKILLPDISQQLGPSTFNTIEIDPFLKGSFDILSIDIENSLKETYPIPIVSGDTLISQAGKIRIALSERYNFQQIIIRCKLNFGYNKDNAIIYPFGLKHIYLYNANYNQYLTDPKKTDKEIQSYIVCKYDLPKGTELNSINHKVKIRTPFSTEEVLCENYGITFYADFYDDVIQLETSELDENSFPGNFTSFYVKVPLIDFGLDDKVYNRTLISIGVNFTTR